MPCFRNKFEKIISIIVMITLLITTFFIDLGGFYLILLCIVTGLGSFALGSLIMFPAFMSDAKDKKERREVIAGFLIYWGIIIFLIFLTAYHNH